MIVDHIHDFMGIFRQGDFYLVTLYVAQTEEERIQSKGFLSHYSTLHHLHGNNGNEGITFICLIPNNVRWH